MHDLFAEFPAVAYADWEKSVAKVLKGAPIDSLTWQPADGVSLQPLYRSEADTQPQIHKNAWRIAEIFDGSAPKLANAQILHALAQGCEEIIIDKAEAANLPLLLEGVWLDMVFIHLRAADAQAAMQLPQALAQLAENKQLTGHIAFPAVSAEQAYELHLLLRKHGLNFSCYTIHCQPSQDRAAALANTIAQATQWLDFCKAQNMSLQIAIGLLQIQVQSDQAYFLQIATCRALRRLWLANLLHLGHDQADFPQILTITDPHQPNLLAATSQALAAAIAGTNSLLVSAPTHWENLDPETAQRLARNIHPLLRFESHLDAVADPAAGAYYIDAATQQLTAAAWQELL